MQDFKSGPFHFTVGKNLVVNGQPSQTWTLFYGNKELAIHTLSEKLTAKQITEAFSEDISVFSQAAKRAHAPDQLLLVEHPSEEVVATLLVEYWPELTHGLIDDRSRYWLLNRDQTFSMPVTLTAFGMIAATHAAPENHWIAGLLPDDIMLDNDDWRAPTSWELRHVVGQGSFTGITGAEAASMVGISQQNFRKYTAQGSVKNQQRISRAAWLKLLKELKIIR